MAVHPHLSSHSPAAHQCQNDLSNGYSDFGAHAFLATGIRARPFCLFLSRMATCWVRPKQSTYTAWMSIETTFALGAPAGRLILSHRFVSGG